MNQIVEMFKPDTLFSTDNPFLKTAARSHRLLFETLDRAARLQLEFCSDALDLNRRRFETLYSGRTMQEKLSAHQELATEFGKRTARVLGDLQETAVNMQSEIREAANDFIPAEDKPRAAAKPRKARAA